MAETVKVAKNFCFDEVEWNKKSSFDRSTYAAKQELAAKAGVAVNQLKYFTFDQVNEALNLLAEGKSIRLVFALAQYAQQAKDRGDYKVVSPATTEPTPAVEVATETPATEAEVETETSTTTETTIEARHPHLAALLTRQEAEWRQHIADLREKRFASRGAAGRATSGMVKRHEEEYETARAACDGPYAANYKMFDVVEDY